MRIQRISSNIPLSPRYDYVRKAVAKTLLRHASNTIPINLVDIINSCHDIELKSYKWYQENMNVSLDYVINKVAKSEEGSITEISDSNGKTEYFLLYNSHKKIGRQRFTIAHELGHYFLDHHSMINDSIISRRGFTRSEYRVLEKEANFFARMLLAPIPLISYMSKDWGVIRRVHLEDIFNITYTVAGYVINHINNQLRNGFINTNDAVVEKYRPALNRFINVHICNICKAEYIQETPNHCPICGHNTIIRIMSNDYEVYHEFERRDYMIYKGVEVDEQSKAITCPECLNVEPENGGYCSICGTYLINKCTNDHHPNRTEFDGPICGRLLAGNARYCTHCGAESTFFQNKILSSWQQALENNDVDLEPDELTLIPSYNEDIPF